MIEQWGIERIGGNCEKAVLMGMLDLLHIYSSHFQGCSMCPPYTVEANNI